METIVRTQLSLGEILQRLSWLQGQLAALLSAQPIRFDTSCRSLLPEEQGLYRIFSVEAPAETIRAGRTKTAAGGLRQRIYQNHLMGTQAGNLRAQLVANGACSNLEEAKSLIREEFAVQLMVVPDATERIWLEHFMLGVLRPRYCD